MADLYPETLDARSMERDDHVIDIGPITIGVGIHDSFMSAGQSDDIQMAQALRQALEDASEAGSDAIDTLRTYAERQLHLFVTLKSLVRKHLSVSDYLDDNQIHEIAHRVCREIDVGQDGRYYFKGRLMTLAGHELIQTMSELESAVKAFVQEKVDTSVTIAD